jgi:uncharacterized membrane protein
MPWTEEQQVNRTIGVLLRVGVTAAAAIVIVAAIWYHAQLAPNPPAYHVFHSQPGELRTPGGVVHAALHGEASAWIQLGLLVLIATPVARVGYSIVAFALQRDWTYVVVTCVVLAVLMCGLWY